MRMCCQDHGKYHDVPITRSCQSWTHGTAQYITAVCVRVRMHASCMCYHVFVFCVRATQITYLQLSEKKEKFGSALSQIPEYAWPSSCVASKVSFSPKEKKNRQNANDLYWFLPEEHYQRRKKANNRRSVKFLSSSRLFPVYNCQPDSVVMLSPSRPDVSPLVKGEVQVFAVQTQLREDNSGELIGALVRSTGIAAATAPVVSCRKGKVFRTGCSFVG